MRIPRLAVEEAARAEAAVCDARNRTLKMRRPETCWRRRLRHLTEKRLLRGDAGEQIGRGIDVVRRDAEMTRRERARRHRHRLLGVDRGAANRRLDVEDIAAGR